MFFIMVFPLPTPTESTGDFATDFFSTDFSLKEILQSSELWGSPYNLVFLEFLIARRLRTEPPATHGAYINPL